MPLTIVMKMKTRYTLLVPIYNLEISPEIGGEVIIGNVSFISLNKLTNSHRKYGIPQPISHYRSHFEKWPGHFLNEASAFACVRTANNSFADHTEEYKRLQEAIFILASSQFYRSGRQNTIYFGGPEFFSHLIDQIYIFDTNSNQFNYNMTIVNSARRLCLDKHWKSNNHFFRKLLALINSNDKKIIKEWKFTIRRAAILAGQSIFARNAWEAFLYDMIAIEVLLTNEGDKFPDAIVKRLSALFGWLALEDSTSWHDLVGELYELRCKFVHDGIYKDISFFQVSKADMLLANLLDNLPKLLRIFKCKSDVISFANKLEARRILGMKLIRPKNISFITKPITDSEEQKLRSMHHWCW